MEDVVITLGGWTRPDVSHGVAELFHVVEVTWGKDFERTVLYGIKLNGHTQQNFMIYCSSKMSWLEEMDRVKIGHIDSPGVGLGTLTSIFLKIESLIHGLSSLIIFTLTWTCIPKKQTSTPSCSSKANMALAR